MSERSSSQYKRHDHTQSQEMSIRCRESNMRVSLSRVLCLSEKFRTENTFHSRALASVAGSARQVFVRWSVRRESEGEGEISTGGDISTPSKVWRSNFQQLLRLPTIFPIRGRRCDVSARSCFLSSLSFSACMHLSSLVVSVFVMHARACIENVARRNMLALVYLQMCTNLSFPFFYSGDRWPSGLCSVFLKRTVK